MINFYHEAFVNRALLVVHTLDFTSSVFDLVGDFLTVHALELKFSLFVVCDVSQVVHLVLFYKVVEI